MAEYLNLLEQYNKRTLIETDRDINIHENKQYEEFKNNLSAYIDNELDNEENLRIKKIAISNPLARQDLENIFTFKKLLHYSYEKTKNDMKSDYSKAIANYMKQELKHEGIIDPFYRIIALLFLMTGFLVCVIVSLLYF